MRTDQATLVLASLLRPRRMFQSYDLGARAKQLVMDVQKALEGFESRLTLGDAAGALDKLRDAYQLLNAPPPAEGAEALVSRLHPLLAFADHLDDGTEAEAWRVLLSEAETAG